MHPTAELTWSIRGCNLHGVGRDVGGVCGPVLTRTALRDALLVAGKLDEAAEVILSQRLQGRPEVLDVRVRFHQPYLVHRVSLPMRATQRGLSTSISSSMLHFNLHSMRPKSDGEKALSRFSPRVTTHLRNYMLDYPTTFTLQAEHHSV